MISDLCEIEEGLTPWEVEFVDSVSKQNPNTLTQKQIDKITQLHQQHC